MPIIAVTANAFEEDKQAALDAGMNGHIPKPVDAATLDRVMQQLISERERRKKPARISKDKTGKEMET